MASMYEMYGMLWPNTIDPLERELDCIRKGGRWRKSKGGIAGAGLKHHWRKAQEFLWPNKKWHKWSELMMECYLKYRYIAIMGCGAAGKSFESAHNVLVEWYCWPYCTTVLVSSTEIESLEMRVWGMIKAAHREAKELHENLPGHLIESRRRIIYDPKNEASEGRDFKNGLVGVPCKRGQTFTGLGNFVGIHNKRVVLLADELSLMPRALLDSVSNLSKTPCFKMIGLGNPKDTTDALGVLAEPAAHLGGWEGAVDQTPGTKTWETKFPKGVCIQLPGSDTPNRESEPGKPWKYPFLINPDQIEDDIKIWGKDSLHFTMMCEGRMPRGQSSRRILTRQACLKFHAMEEVIWKDTHRTRIAALDAAYRGTGGDRCTFCELQFGEQSETPPAPAPDGQFVNQGNMDMRSKIVIAMIDMLIVPINVSQLMDLPEDQIAQFVKAECEKRAIPPENFFFDSTGRGSLASAFGRIWSPHVVAVEFGGKPDDRKVSQEIDVSCKDYYFNMVTELWHDVRLAVESGQVRGMTDEVVKEFCYREWKMVSSNKIQVETKEEMKLKSGRSPDLADCFATGLHGAIARGFQIAKTMARSKSNDQLWKKQLQERARESWKQHQLEYAA